ncbi:alpha/beta fold hydrolase [Saccharopolyspora mangrovi]|uniref:Alpha/beta fold hydrolase n=1 Tax=Saccharopolyspora mangrovi TaxID=3082379 RepID=A0ABU6AF03_9PSEU|nr:alpha/beta fold hydrolase [Saccharopolyspora sp. S2-29]MEB3370021.1 alpha/beta fold hydrolase [Saccharopolyspora sp. S2-29]
MKEHRFSGSGGVTLHTRECGEPDAPTVVLVHGYPDTGEVWNPVLPHLTTRYHLVTYDVRGTGRSGPGWSYGGYELDRWSAISRPCWTSPPLRERASGRPRLGSHPRLGVRHRLRIKRLSGGLAAEKVVRPCSLRPSIGPDCLTRNGRKCQATAAVNRLVPPG